MENTKITGLENQIAATEISKRLEDATQELAREQAKLMAVIRMSGDLIFEYHIAEDHMTYSSPGEGLLFATQITENYTKALKKLVKKEDAAARDQLVEALCSGQERFSVEFRRRNADGTYHWVRVMGETIYDAEEKPERVLGKICNIDEQKRLEEELREKSQKDSLTGLYNHTTAQKLIAQQLKKLPAGSMGYLIVGDVDDFKEINDANGHLFGDAVLCSMADSMTALFPDAIKGRIGGDEFILYVEGMDKAVLGEQLSKLNHSMSDRYDDDKMGIHISCSLGVAATDGSVTDYTRLFQWADAALYQVKEKGKSSYHILDAAKDETFARRSYLMSQHNKKDRIIHKETVIRTTEDLILFCVEMMENVSNITSALKMVAERTCRFFHLDDMVCVEHHGTENTICYQWSSTEKSDFAKRINMPGVFQWDMISQKTDESGVIVYREQETADIEKEQAKSVLVVLSTEEGSFHGSVVFSDRHQDRNWEDARETLTRIANQVFMRLRLMQIKEKEKRELNRKLNFDALSGLPVYNRFVDQTEEYIVKNGKEGLYFVSSDFSNFQYLNDVYGYEVGDRILHDFAVALQQKCSFGILFCRVTSDHFVGLLQAQSPEQVSAAYLEFTKNFVQQMNGRYEQCNLVVASGIYQVQEGDWTVASMMDKANEARKQCKEQKVDTAVVVYTEQIRQKLETTKTIVSGMVSAYNNKEFCAYLQPKVSLHTGKVIGAEALVRWIRPDGSMVMPGQFIDIFERNGFITKVDFAILDQVMEYLREALDAQEEVVPVSVNFSRRHNEFGDFVPNILKSLKNYHVPEELLEVEVTESVFMSDLNTMYANLRKLREEGVEVSVDDFGSGYSSLNLLSKVAVDTVKLDKQFLDDTMNGDREETALTIIKYLTKMLKHLGFKVLAEGVETVEQLEMLRQADCDSVQGYYYAKPMPIPEFRKFLQKFNR